MLSTATHKIIFLANIWLLFYINNFIFPIDILVEIVCADN